MSDHHRYYGYKTDELNKYKHIDALRRNSIDLEESIFEPEYLDNNKSEIEGEEVKEEANRSGSITKFKIKRESRYGKNKGIEDRPLVSPRYASSSFPFVRSDEDERPIQPMKDDFFKTVENLSLEDNKDEDKNAKAIVPFTGKEEEKTDDVLRLKKTETQKKLEARNKLLPLRKEVNKNRLESPRLRAKSPEKIIYPIPVFYPIPLPQGFSFSYPQIPMTVPQGVRSSFTPNKIQEIKDDDDETGDEKKGEFPVSILKKDDKPKPKIKKKVRYEAPDPNYPYYTFTSGDPNLEIPKNVWEQQNQFNNIYNNPFNYNNPQMPLNMYNPTYSYYPQTFNQPNNFFY